MNITATQKKQSNWHARLELGYKNVRNKTILSHRLHKGPLVVQKPFYPEEDVCHSYLIHPPGGIVGGDIIELDVKMQSGAHALITTPAANKFYRSDNIFAHLNQSFEIGNDAVLEWLPQETIFYNDSNASINTEFDLDTKATLVAWEINCFGRPAGNEFFQEGNVKQKIVIKRNGVPLYIDRNIINAHSGILDTKWGLNNFPVMATMFVTLMPEIEKVVLEQLLTLQEHSSQRLFSFTVLDEIVVIRYFGHHAREALSLFEQCWSVLRPQLIGRSACPPRIWET